MISVARLECTMSFLHLSRTVFFDEYHVYVLSKLVVWGFVIVKFAPRKLQLSNCTRYYQMQLWDVTLPY
jgi:hypothetical protein